MRLLENQSKIPYTLPNIVISDDKLTGHWNFKLQYLWTFRVRLGPIPRWNGMPQSPKNNTMQENKQDITAVVNFRYFSLVYYDTQKPNTEV